FSFMQGQGKVQRIVLAESAIDAMSVAALTKYKHLTTLYLATDGTGTLPLELLRDCIARGGQIILAQDADRAGEKQAWNVVKTLGAGNIIRAAPSLGKDWNEFLQATVAATQLERWCKISEWWRIAQAIGKTNKYVDRVKVVTAEVESSQPLSKEAKASMEQDFDRWREIGYSLWKWWRAAVTLEKTADDLQQIADIALAFFAEQHPLPLSPEILLQVQQDLKLSQQLYDLHSRIQS
ncbi:toprim domain-containing protein, partial [Chroococcidiopsidales cyanobacterium LEGE 13417]|nr:toprim domain-containing protein [Chroococcidiopsidales cyanobacterium LEGE 13417]